MPTPTQPTQQPRRNVWILTGYGIVGLAMLGAMAYAISNYIAR